MSVLEAAQRIKYLPCKCRLEFRSLATQRKTEWAYVNPWRMLANWANPCGSGFSKRPCPSNKAGRVTEGVPEASVTRAGWRSQSKLPSSSLPCFLSCPFHRFPFQVHFWPPILSPIFSFSPLQQPPCWPLPARPLSLQALGRLLGRLGHGSELRSNKRENRANCS